ncbi:DNA methyltransferase [Microbacterium sp. LMI1-1-1.1]|uniref:DNA methyltransferase n=1 Tax=Microbacterium sp. LMI1-1-1.1 TaxID=3135223 RepID=UPI003466AA48
MTKPLSLNEIRQRAAGLALAWRDAEGYERGEAQSFLRDLLQVYGVTESRAAVYERRVKRASTDAAGYIDALIPGLLLVEMKSAGKDLVEAEQQALDYLPRLAEVELPRWVLTSDFRTFRLLDLHARTDDAVTTFTLDELPAQADRLAFIAGYGTRSFGSAEQERASIKAAQIMAGLWEELEGSGYSDHEASIFLVRTLFALYADDAGVWPRGLFYEFIETRTATDGHDLGSQLSFLYQVMARPAHARQRNLDELTASFPYVNGGIFEEPLSIPSFDTAMRTRLIEACLFDWSAISPAIFGSLFQAVKNRQARRELGEHYTTETNIMKVLGPMFLDELRQRFADAANDERKLRRLRDDMSKMRFLDPACGCGNFLVVAYREMRALDLAVLQRLQELGARGAAPTLYFNVDDLPVRLAHFHGIELEEWPARIAATALHLVEHQANQAMELSLGHAPELLPLDKVESIIVGNALRMQWSEVLTPTDDTYVLGNPPFIGMALMSTEQQEDNRLVFAEVDSAGLRTGRLDYVACWYAKAMAYTRTTRSAQIAFVSTNSLTQGEQARTMLPLLARNGFAVDFGHQTFRWTSEAPGAAAVHCIIVGFSPQFRTRRRPRLFTYPTLQSDPIEQSVRRLNFYLTDGPDVVPEKLTRPASPAMPNAHKGSQPTDGGGLIVTEEEYPLVLADPQAARYLRRFVQGQDMLQGSPARWCLWLRDAEPRDLRNSPVLRERLASVRRSRETSPTASVREYAERPARFTQDRQPPEPFFALPEVSSSVRRWVPGRFFTPDVVAGNKLIIFPGALPHHAALLQSSMFMAWVSVFAGRLKSDISISPALAYFPIPWPTLNDAAQARLSEAWAHVEGERAEHPGSTLADLYSPDAMPSNLLTAHADLDTAVDAAFGLRRRRPTQSDRLALLLDRVAAGTSDMLTIAKAASRTRR